MIERAFGVKIIWRSPMLTVDGERVAANRALKVIRFALAQIEQGKPLFLHELNRLINNEAHEEISVDRDARGSRLLVAQVFPLGGSSLKQKRRTRRRSLRLSMPMTSFSALVRLGQAKHI